MFLRFLLVFPLDISCFSWLVVALDVVDISTQFVLSKKVNEHRVTFFSLACVQYIVLVVANWLMCGRNPDID